MNKLKIQSENSLYDAAELFKIFSDSTRIKILYCLIDKDLNVNEIVKEVKMNQSAVSHQLRILKASKLIKSKKVGRNVNYALADKHVYNILAQGIEHSEE